MIEYAFRIDFHVVSMIHAHIWCFVTSTKRTIQTKINKFEFPSIWIECINATTLIASYSSVIAAQRSRLFDNQFFRCYRHLQWPRVDLFQTKTRCVADGYCTAQLFLFRLSQTFDVLEWRVKYSFSNRDREPESLLSSNQLVQRTEWKLETCPRELWRCCFLLSILNF